MSIYTQSPNVIILGAGPSGIAMAHTLKKRLSFDDFTLYEKLPGVGGTWLTNTYPGCGCDIPSHLYSFSFNINPNWTEELCCQEEILQYMNDTVDKFHLRDHIRLETECTGARWNGATELWEVEFQDVITNIRFVRHARILISAVGAISYPRDVKFPGMEKFQGEMFHTARWNHGYDYTGKRMAVIGNGCSGAQVIPNVVRRAGYVKQFARSPQWYTERPNRLFSSWEKWSFKYIPLWAKFFRLRIFLATDAANKLYQPGKDAESKRKAVEEEARDYIYKYSPKKYHDILVPDFPLGCKRRVFDPGYLEALHNKNMNLVAEGIKEIDEKGIISSSGIREEFDVIVFATGFEVASFLVPMEMYGSNGISLREQWSESRGAQAYYGTFVHNFPNFAILFGPNTFPASNSALFSVETQIDYVAKVLLSPVIDTRAKIVEVKNSAEDRFVNNIQDRLAGTVYSADCSNWYVNDFGRNVTSWPGFARSLWTETFWPKYSDFNIISKSKFWRVKKLMRMIKVNLSTPRWATLLLLAWFLLGHQSKTDTAVAAQRDIFSIHHWVQNSFQLVKDKIAA